MNKSGLCSTCKLVVEPERKGQALCRSCHNAYMRVNRKKHSELTEIQKLKSLARSKVHLYVKRGSIKKLPCCNCGDINSEAHHEDYTKPLDIAWLCRKCHLQYHKSKLDKPLKIETRPIKAMTEKLCNGCMPDEKIAAWVVKKNQMERVNDVAWWERRNKKEVVQEALTLYLATKADVPERKKA
jgi:hypothetical protein